MHCPGGNATEPIWRVLASSPGISSWTPLKPQHSNQLWKSCFSKVYSNSYCSCSFKPEIIKIGQPSHKKYSKKILNFQDSTTIWKSCTKTVWKLIECTTYIHHQRTSVTDTNYLLKGLIQKAFRKQKYYYRTKYMIFKSFSSKHNKIFHYYLYLI